jgi:hypothetical protein
MRVGLGVVGGALLLQATATTVTAIVATTVLGVGLSCAVVGLVTQIQRATPNELLGRAWSAVELLWAVPYATAIGAGSLAVDAIGFLPLCLVGGCGLVTMAAIGVRERRSVPAVAAAPQPAP